MCCDISLNSSYEETQFMGTDFDYTWYTIFAMNRILCCKMSVTGFTLVFVNRVLNLILIALYSTSKTRANILLYSRQRQTPYFTISSDCSQYEPICNQKPVETDA